MANSYDYVVIGAGSAGAVLAARLSEDRDVRVLLLEAGGRDIHPLMAMPIAFIKVAQSKPFIWNFESEPEPGLNGRRLPARRGRVLGGSSSINALIYARGHRLDYDLWRQRGLDGWSYDDVLPYFRKLEDSWRGADEYHGVGGPVRVEPGLDPDLLYEPVAEAAARVGYATTDDPNGVVQEGVARLEHTIAHGRRASTAFAYLRPARSRPNLTVVTWALTTRIVVERGRAVGVEFARRGKREAVRAAREVLLCGGSFNSPQLLMLSGIGPADHLKEVGVTPIHDLPGVGRNLGEHPNFTVAWRLKREDTFIRFLRYDRATLAVLRWYLSHRGPFAQSGAAINMFLRSRPEAERPDVQLVGLGIANSAELWFPGLTAAPLHQLNCRIGALHPESRGWVKLRSADPSAPPRIFFNMFAAKSDLDTMVRAVRMARDIYAQAPLDRWLDGEIFPGVDVAGEAALAEMIRNHATHRSHPVGTCAMGIDENAVVDAQLRVRGIEGLRVVDASVMPEVPGGNTNIPTIMIAEKAADMIRGR